jgi:hypothetical protein
MDMGTSFASASAYQNIVAEALNARFAPFVSAFSKGKSVLRVVKKAPELRGPVLYAEVRATFADPVWGGSKPARLIAEIHCHDNNTADVTIWFTGCGTMEGRPLNLSHASAPYVLSAMPGALAHIESWMNERRYDVE